MLLYETRNIVSEPFVITFQVAASLCSSVWHLRGPVVAPHAHARAGSSRRCPGVLQLCGSFHVITAPKSCHEFIRRPAVFLHYTWGLFKCLLKWCEAGTQTCFLFLRRIQTVIISHHLSSVLCSSEGQWLWCGVWWDYVCSVSGAAG